MFVYRYIIRYFLSLRYAFHWLTRTGSFGPGPAVFSDPSPGKDRKNTLQGGLLRHHVKQFHESSCSVASVVSAVNTLIERATPPLRHPVTQKEILDRVRAEHWKERMGPGGYKGKRGLPLEVLGRVVAASLAEYGLDNARAEVVRMKGGRHQPMEQQRLIRDLEEFQIRDNCLLIAHFDQGTYLTEFNIPHISPVGGFDPKTLQVTVLDVDPFVSGPYQLPLFRFYRGMATRYGGFFTPFGYGRGGYVKISLT